MRLKIPTPISGGLILSYKCNSKCLHCIYACSPQWPADWISEADLAEVLGQLAGKIKPNFYGPETIGLSTGLHFTGGEPFLNFELLCTATEMAHELGIPSLFVETNCYWATTDHVTREKLRLLKSKGLHGIMISVNPFYLEYVPFERTERAIRLSLEVFGQNVAVYQVEYYRRFLALGMTDCLPFAEYLKLERKQDLVRNVEFFWMGRAAYQLEAHLPGLFPRFPAKRLWHQPCRPEFLRNWHNHFDNYGNYVPGFCGGISFGDCRRLNHLLREGIESAKYPVLTYLMQEDLAGLFQFARERGFAENEAGYFSKCHLCTDIRMFLVTEGDYAELQPKTFYQQLSL